MSTRSRRSTTLAAASKSRVNSAVSPPPSPRTLTRRRLTTEENKKVTPASKKKTSTKSETAASSTVIPPSPTSRSGRTLKKRKFDDDEDEEEEHASVKESVDNSSPSNRKKQKTSKMTAAAASGRKSNSSKKKSASKLSQRKKPHKRSTNTGAEDDEDDEMRSVDGEDDDASSSEEEEEADEDEMSDAESRADEWCPEDDKDDDGEYDEDGDLISLPESVAVPKSSSSHPSTSFMDIIERPNDPAIIASMLSCALEDKHLDINQQSTITGNSFAFVLYTTLMTERGRNRRKQHLMQNCDAIIGRILKTLDIKIVNHAGHNFLHHICSPSAYTRGTHHQHFDTIERLLYACLGWKMSFYTPDAEGNYPLHDFAKSCARGLLSNELFYTFVRPRRKYSIDLSHVDKNGISVLSHLFSSYPSYSNFGYGRRRRSSNRAGRYLMVILKTIAKQPALLSQIDLENENESKQSLRDVLSQLGQPQVKFFLDAWQEAALPKLRSEVGVYLIKDLTEIVLEYVVKVGGEDEKKGDEEKKQDDDPYAMPPTLPLQPLFPHYQQQFQPMLPQQQQQLLPAMFPPQQQQPLPPAMFQLQALQQNQQPLAMPQQPPTFPILTQNMFQPLPVSLQP